MRPKTWAFNDKSYRERKEINYQVSKTKIRTRGWHVFILTEDKHRVNKKSDEETVNGVHQKSIQF